MFVIVDDEVSVVRFVVQVLVRHHNMDKKLIKSCQNLENLKIICDDIREKKPERCTFLVDYRMPFLQFSDAVDCIVSLSREINADVEIIGMSGDHTVMDEMLKWGADRFVEKIDVVRFIKSNVF